MASWYEVTCEVPAADSEAVAELLAELSGCGVCMENRQVDTFAVESIAPLATAVITGYFTHPSPIEQHVARIVSFLGGLGGPAPPAAPQVRLVAEEDWADSWKSHFRPMTVGRRLLVTPSWETAADAGGRQVIIIDPGMAFGTGGHETTRLCLRCLEQVLGDGAHASRILDLGTGSGILAIAAAKLGAGQVDAVDIDEQAVRIAAENCSLNQVAEQVRCSATPLKELGEGYDVILANILAEELVRLAPEIVRRLAVGGSVILSGILAEREAFVRSGFDSFPLALEAAHADGEWSCLHYRRTA